MAKYCFFTGFSPLRVTEQTDSDENMAQSWIFIGFYHLRVTE